MAICSKCGAELSETSRFCPECGTPVTEMSEEALEAAAEKALEDIPKIVKLQGVSDIHTADASTPSKHLPKAEEKASEKENDEYRNNKASVSEKDDFSDMGAYDPSAASAFKEMAEQSKTVENKKGGKVAVIVIIAVVIAAAAAGVCVFLMNKGTSDTPVSATEQVTTVESVSEITETAASVTEKLPALGASDDISESEESEAVTSEAQVTESEITETETSITEAEPAVSMKTAEELAAGVEIIPEHKPSSENEASCTISLASEGLSADMLSEGGLFVVSYTSETDESSAVQAGMIPVTLYMTVTINGQKMDISASSSGNGVAVFEFANMVSAAAANGFTAEDIDTVSFMGTETGVDVTAITVMMG